MVMGNKPQKLSANYIKDLQKEVDFTGEEIQQWYKEYTKSCRYGRHLTEKEFSEVYTKTFGGDATQFARHVFRTFDGDGNGKVDFKEFLVGLSVTASDNLEKKLKWAFKMYDIDGNGSISREEMTSLMTVNISKKLQYCYVGAKLLPHVTDANAIVNNWTASAGIWTRVLWLGSYRHVSFSPLYEESCPRDLRFSAGATLHEGNNNFPPEISNKSNKLIQSIS